MNNIDDLLESLQFEELITLMKNPKELENSHTSLFIYLHMIYMHYFNFIYIFLNDFG